MNWAVHVHVAGILSELAPLLLAAASLVVALRGERRSRVNAGRLDAREGYNEPYGVDMPPSEPHEAGY